MRLIAFDIDGTLTRPEVRDVFREVSDDPDTIAGVVTSRSPARSAAFIDQHQLQIDFEESALSKVSGLLRERVAHDADEYVYVANTRRDQFAARVTGFRFVSPDEVESVLRR